MGTPSIAATVLQYMIDANINIELVVSQPDKKVGRKQIVTQTPVKELAVKHNIPVFQPYKLKDEVQTILDLKPDLIVTCAYGQWVPESILNCPKYGCVNLHGSLLPKYRGGAPIQYALLNGDKKTGMSLMKMAKAMDAGPVLAVKSIDIQEDDNATSLFDKLGHVAGELLLENFDRICSEDAEYVEQDESKATLSPIISKAQERIDFGQSDEAVCNQIRALSMTPGAYCMLKNKKFKILKAHYKKEPCDSKVVLGLIEGCFAIGLHEGMLLIETCQMEGKPVLTGKEFYNGQGRQLVGLEVE